MYYLLFAVMYIMIFVYGSTIGSFLNVVIHRLPKKEDIVLERSHCPSCGEKIKSYDLIPVISYLLLRGRCRNCKTYISKRYPLVEMFTGVICVITFMVNGCNVVSIILFIFAAILIAIGFIDWDTMTIPDSLVISIIVCSVPLFFLQPEISVWERLVGFVVISVPMLLLTMIVPGAFGGGDIKLMAASGLVLGLGNNVVAAFIGVLIGGTYAIYLLRMKKVEKKSHMPFGPSLCIGCYIAALFGDAIIQWYLRFF